MVTGGSFNGFGTKQVGARLAKSISCDMDKGAKVNSPLLNFGINFLIFNLKKALILCLVYDCEQILKKFINF